MYVEETTGEGTEKNKRGEDYSRKREKDAQKKRRKKG
jgi:hypothetical protein